MAAHEAGVTPLAVFALLEVFDKSFFACLCSLSDVEDASPWP
jgi:hypothetical protein